MRTIPGANFCIGSKLAMIVVAGSFFVSTANLCAQNTPNSPAIQNAINRGVAHLHDISRQLGTVRSSVAAYALLKSGQPATDPLVAATLQRIQGKIISGVYRPSQHHVYEAGVDAMALEAADPENYYSELEAIAAYLISRQQSAGHWDYPSNANRGDTSISQYGLLGLWAASRAGVDIPLEAWDRAAGWHVRTQLSNGGFGYHPLAGGTTARHSMTVAGTGSLLITRLFLYPDAGEIRGSRPSPPLQPRKKKRPRRRFGVLERIEFDKPKEDDANNTPTITGPTVSLAQIDKSISGGIQWMSSNFTVEKPTGWTMYYFYGLERMAALANRKQIGTHDWYKEGATRLVRTQMNNGAWTGQSGNVATCFGLLFLGKATAKSMTPRPRKPVISVGAGLLAGGRGLPDDLSAVDSKDGRVTTRKNLAPLDELLKQLADPKLFKIESTQAAFVEAVQIGDRKELIGQIDLLKKLTKNRRVEIRRTAIWALGRSEDVRVARLLIDALNDTHVSVMVEARNALCVLSRKPNGFGLTGSPLNGLPENSTADQKKTAIEKWRVQALKFWEDWYKKYRPYNERDNLRQR